MSNPTNDDDKGRTSSRQTRKNRQRRQQDARGGGEDAKATITNQRRLVVLTAVIALTLFHAAQQERGQLARLLDPSVASGNLTGRLMGFSFSSVRNRTSAVTSLWLAEESAIAQGKEDKPRIGLTSSPAEESPPPPVTFTTTMHSSASSPSSSPQQPLLQNLHLAMIGDSLSRHQHLSLVHYLNTGGKSWESDPRFIEGKAGAEFPTNQDHRTFISETLNLTQACNCYRPEGHYMAKKQLHRMYDNMYYMDSTKSNYVTLISKFGSYEAHGHYDPKTAYEPEVFAQHTAENNVTISRVPPYLWRGNWSYVIREHLAWLQPKPKYVVINAGLWEDHDLGLDLNNETTVLRDIQLALNETGMIGIYKSTTKVRGDTSTDLVPHDEAGCQLLPYCLNISWTGTVGPEGYQDDKHFRGHVYARMNRQLLDLIKTIDQDQLLAAT